ncbi:hypothetical protein [Kozakia baliensis]|uniref:Uncharacterized protein n=1 Tax=Kozakia baliensis TaxID=153496 RepID=A0A1D8UU47_9PROT|nr:hypothetical protein [Kozakia baliensis]AOX17168.1 hypothetical protein A0U89_08455 [Kozakia baliensis]GBR32447.1 hypothetical protein AA0488_2546 [Kozakia baliensis NRIC 0488]GEL64486.1 hypothetical protein KBA01_17720 [Kozakia baliensis]
MKTTSSITPSASEVSIRTTLLRTVSLVFLTIVFAASVRFIKPIGHIVTWVAGTEAWQSLYRVLGIESGLGREQLILTGIMVVCFALALVVQTGVLFALEMRRR